MCSADLYDSMEEDFRKLGATIQRVSRQGNTMAYEQVSSPTELVVGGE